MKGIELLARIEASTGGYLQDKGWFRSRATRRSIDSNGNSCPWFTYPAIAFLSPLVNEKLRVLEYGSGAGTEWWSQRCGDVTAVEDNSAWGEKVAIAAPNARVLMESSGSERDYITRADEYSPFDVVIVDGLHREGCLDHAPSIISSTGIVILDDAQRSQYQEAVHRLVEMGFRSLPFWGPQPVSKHEGCTLILYRPENVLNL